MFFLSMDIWQYTDFEDQAILDAKKTLVIYDHEPLKLEDEVAALVTFEQINEDQDCVINLEELDEEDGSYLFEFEASRQQIQVKKRLFSSVTPDHQNWRIYLTYAKSNKKQEIYFFQVDRSPRPKPSVQLNPNKLFPLTAYIYIDFLVAGKVELVIKRRDEKGVDLVKKFAHFTKSHKIPVLGLYENYNNQVILKFTNHFDEPRFEIPLEIKTAPINRTEHEFGFDIRKELPGPKYRGMFLFWERYITDTLGYLRWYTNFKRRIVIQYHFPLPAGRIALLSTGGRYIKICNYMGEVLHEFENRKLVTHDVTEKSPGGNLLMITMFTNRPYITDDGIIEYNPHTGKIEREIDTKLIYDENRPLMETKFYDPSHTWIHLNSVTYIKEDNSLLISSRNQNFISKVDYDDPTKIKWIVSHHFNWTEKYQKYLLKPTNFNKTYHEEQDWPLWPHNPVLLPNGNLMVIDDGGARPGFGFYPDPETEIKKILPGVEYLKIHYPNGVDPGYIRAIEYKIDPVEMTITKVFEYTDFPSLPASILGSNQMIDDDVVLIGYGEFRFMSIVNKTSMECLWQANSSYEFYRVIPVDVYAFYE